MSIQTTCSHCSKTFKVPDQYAGKRIRCPKCKEPVTISSEARAPAAEKPAVRESAGEKPADTGKSAAVKDDKLVCACPSCEKKFRVPKEHAGKRIRCPSCKEPVTVPGKPGILSQENDRPSSGKQKMQAGAGEKTGKKEKPAKKAKNKDQSPKKSSSKLKSVLVFLILGALAFGGLYYYDKSMKPREIGYIDNPFSVLPAQCTAYGAIHVNKLLSLDIVQKEKESIQKQGKAFVQDNFTGTEGLSKEALALKEEITRTGMLEWTQKRFRKIIIGADTSQAVSGSLPKKPPVLFVCETKKPMEEDLKAFLELAQTPYETVKGENGIPVITFRTPESGPVSVFCTQNLMIMGDPKLVSPAIRLAGKPGAQPSILQEKNLYAISSGVRNDTVWLAWKVGEKEKKMMQRNKPPMVAADPDDIDTLLFSVNYAEQKGLAIRLNLGLKTPDNAPLIKDELQKNIAPMAGLFLGLGEKELSITAKEATVRLALTLTPEKIEELRNMKQSMSMVGPGSQGSPGNMNTRPQRPSVDFEEIASQIPDAPLSGKIHGRDFTYHAAELVNGILTVRDREDYFNYTGIQVFTFINETKEMQEKVFRISPGEFNAPHVWKKWVVEGESVPRSKAYMDDYTLYMEFGKIENDRITGRLSLKLPDAEKSAIRGTFRAEVK